MIPRSCSLCSWGGPDLLNFFFLFFLPLEISVVHEKFAGEGGGGDVRACSLSPWESRIRTEQALSGINVIFV